VYLSIAEVFDNASFETVWQRYVHHKVLVPKTCMSMLNIFPAKLIACLQCNQYKIIMLRASINGQIAGPCWITHCYIHQSTKPVLLTLASPSVRSTMIKCHSIVKEREKRLQSLLNYTLIIAFIEQLAFSRQIRNVPHCGK
jgi:hypothetical protein